MALDVGTLQFNLVGNVASFITSMGAANAAVLGVGAVVGATAFVIGSSLKAYEEFEAALTQVKITTKATDDELKGIEETIREQAKVTKFTATETANAYNYLALAGLSVAEATEALPIVLQTATAANMDLARTSDLLTDSISAAGLEMSTMGDVANVFLAISQNANTSMEQLMEGFISVAPRARTLGQEIDTTSAILGILADNGLKASEGGNAADRALRQLAKTGGEGEKVLKDLGVAIYDANGNMRQADEIFLDLNTSMAEYSDEQKNAALQTIFGSTAMQAGSILMNASAEDWEKLKIAAQESGGGIEQAAEDFANTIEGKKAQVSSALEELKLIIGEQFGPIFKEVLDGIIALLLTLGEIIQPVMEKVGEIFKELTSSVEGDGEKQKETFNGIIELLNTLQGAFDLVWGFIRDNILPIITDFADSIEENLLPIFNDIVDIINENLLPAMEGVKGFIEENIMPIIDQVAGIINEKLLPAINDWWDWFKEKMLPVFEEFWGKLEEKVVPKLEELFEAVGELITEFEKLWDVIGPIIIPVLQFLYENFVKVKLEIWEKLLPVLLELAKFFIDRLKGDIEKVNDTIQKMKDKWNTIKDVVEKVKTAFNDLKDNSINALNSAMDTLSNKIQKVIDKLKDLKDKASSAVSGAIGAVSGAIGNIGGRSLAAPAMVGVGINNNMEKAYTRTTGAIGGNGSLSGSTTNKYYISQSFDGNVSQRDIEIGTKQALSANEQIKEGVQ